MLNYIILREERTTFDGNYEINLNYFKNFFKINSNDGFIELISSNTNVKDLSEYMSILVVVKVQDLTLISSSTECILNSNYLSKKSKIINFFHKQVLLIFDLQLLNEFNTRRLDLSVAPLGLNVFARTLQLVHMSLVSEHLTPQLWLLLLQAENLYATQ